MVKSNQLQANWDVIDEKFTVHLKAHFSNLDLDGWLSHFANGHSIDINQFEGDSQYIKNPKKYRLYYGSLPMSLLRFRIPLKLMASKLFSKLKNESYKKSEIYLLGIHLEDDVNAFAYVKFDRYNNSNSIYYSAKALYKLIKVNSEWYITQISTYNNNEYSDKLVGFDKFWYPNKVNH